MSILFWKSKSPKIQSWGVNSSNNIHIGCHMVIGSMKKIQARAMERVKWEWYFLIHVQTRHADKETFKQGTQGEFLP